MASSRASSASLRQLPGRVTAPDTGSSPDAPPARDAASRATSNEAARDYARALIGTETYLRSARGRNKIETLFGDVKRNLGLTRLRLRGLGETIEIEAEVADDLWPIKLDQEQLELALLNVALNARDAMADGGRLTIEAANAHIDEALAAKHPNVVCCDVSGRPRGKQTGQPFFYNVRRWTLGANRWRKHAS